MDGLFRTDLHPPAPSQDNSIGKWITDYFRVRCNAEDKLLNQDYRPTYPGSRLNSDQTASGEAAISFLNSGLGPANY